MNERRTTYVQRKPHTDSGGVSFWRVFLAILAALVLAGGVIVAGCLVLFGTVAVNMSKAKQEQDAYRWKLTAEVSNVEYSGTGNYMYVRGTVKNTGDKTVRYWKLALRFLDRPGGAVIDTDYTNSTETLPPGATKTFEVTHRSDDRIKTVITEVEEVRIEPGR